MYGAHPHARFSEEPRIGHDAVDAEHDRIFAIIDEFAELACGNTTLHVEQVHHLLERLIVTSRQHFITEDQFMVEAGCDARHVQQHAIEHAEFLRQVSAIDASRGFDTPHGLSALHEYLRSWFSFHVRGLDVSLGRQVKAMADGVDASRAFEQAEARLEFGPSQVLLESLGNMVSLVVSRNVALAEAEEGLRNANRLLEKRVAVRTSELEQRNEEIKESLAKLEETQNQLMQSERMASIGQLAAGVAHEINNPVGFVNSNLGTLTQYLDSLLTLLDRYVTAEDDLPESLRAELAAIRASCDLDYLRGDIVDLVRESREGLSRVTAIIQDLKTFAHLDSGAWKAVDLLKGLKSTLNVVANELRYKATVVDELTPLPLVICLPGQINQVFMNLLVNAADAIEGRGAITLRCGVQEGDVWIEVGDSGCGMTPEVVRRIFDPFFTTKDVGKGTGLGLPLSYGIVRKHGGRIEVDSEPGSGTRMRVWLPVEGAEDADLEQATEPPGKVV